MARLLGPSRLTQLLKKGWRTVWNEEVKLKMLLSSSRLLWQLYHCWQSWISRNISIIHYRDGCFWKRDRSSIDARRKTHCLYESTLSDQVQNKSIYEKELMAIGALAVGDITCLGGIMWCIQIRKDWDLGLIRELWGSRSTNGSQNCWGLTLR